jgi:hypothetical protein
MGTRPARCWPSSAPRREVIAPREDRALEAAAGGELPVGLGRQLLAGPGGVGLGIGVGKVNHRISLVPRDCAVRTLIVRRVGRSLGAGAFGRRLAGRSSRRCPPLLTPGQNTRRLNTVRMARRRRRTVSGPVAVRQDPVRSFDRFESTRVVGPGEPIARKANDLRTPPAPDQPLKPVVEIPSTSRRWKAMKNPTIGSRDRSDIASVCPQELRLVASMNALRATGTV